MRYLFILLILGNVFGLDLKLGYTNNFWFLQPVIIKAKGWDVQEGINFDLVKFTSPAAQLQGFVSSGIDGINNNGAALVFAKDKGIDFTVIANLVKGDIALLSGEDLNSKNFIEKIKKFNTDKGRKFKIVTNPKGSLSHLIIEMYLAEVFKDYKNYIELIHAGDQIQLQQIYLTKQADAISSFEPFTSVVLKKDPASKMVISPEDINKHQLGGFLGIKNKILSENPGLTEKLVKLYQKASDFIKSNPKEVFELVKDDILMGTFNEQDGVAMVKHYGNYITNPLEDNREEFKKLENYLLLEKYISKASNIAENIYVKK